MVDDNTVAGFGDGYAISTTAGATAAKEVTINGFTPTIGGIFSVLFQNGFTASDPTLNVSNTGAKDLKLFGSALPASFVPDGTILTLTYDGTNYNVVGRLNDITVKSTLESTDSPLLQDANGNFIKSTPAALASLLGERQITIKTDTNPVFVLQRTSITGDCLISFKPGRNNTDPEGITVNFGVVQYEASAGVFKYKLVVTRGSNSITLADNL